MKDKIAAYLERHGFGALCPKAVLFDMDGVLYDSMPNHAIAWQQSMASFGIDMQPADAYMTEGQRGVDTIAAMVSQQQGRTIDTAEAQAMYDEKTRLFHLMPPPPIMPFTTQLMQQLRAQGLAVGVVTGSGQRPLIDRLLTDFAAFLEPGHIVTAYDTDRGKPAPDPYLAGLAKLGGLKPCEAIVVENAPLGVRAAVAANIFTIAINTGPLPDELLSREGADVVLPSMERLASAWGSLSDSFTNIEQRQ